MIKLFMFLLLAATAVLFAVPAQADTTFTLTWDTPTKRVDGTPLPVTDIKEYDLRHNAPGMTQWQAMPSHPVSVNQTTFVAKTPGEYCFQIRTEDTAGRKSTYTASVCAQYTSEPAAPNMKISKIEWVDG